jgi:hypothetical protein
VWAPRNRSWWIGVLFAIGSACFVIGPFPGFVHLVGAVADAAVFFAGSLCFTSAATLQFLDTPKADRIDRWAGAIQLAGTLFFNLSTGRALNASIDLAQEDRLIWRPDAFGSVCFLVASALAWLAVRGARDRGWWIAVINLAGSIAFGVSAVAGYVVPATGDYRNLAAANVSTVVGALCFLTGALLLLVDGARARRAPQPVRLEPA